MGVLFCDGVFPCRVMFSCPLLFREHLLRTLRDCGYAVQELMVSPTHVRRRLIRTEEDHPTLTSPDGTFSVCFLFNQFGIPNSRLRYYLLAKLSGQKVRPAETGSGSIDSPVKQPVQPAAEGWWAVELLQLLSLTLCF